MRKDLFLKFWKEMDWKQKRVYVVNLIEKVEVAQRTTSGRSRRNCSFRYHLWKKDERLCVCKNMFTSTLGLSEKTIHNWVSDANFGLPKSPSTSTKDSNYQKMKRDSASEFLESLPNVPSHYCRSNSSKKYLEPLFGSLGDVYREYCSKCTEKGTPVFNKTGFLELFHEMNLALWQPKKDQCDICCSFEAGNLDENIYQTHLKRKDEARDAKLKDKDHALQDSSTKVLTLDLQSLLLCPKLKASSLYYKTKLSCHNFTIYDLATKDVSCYFWHEAEGELTANCFSSCVIHYLNALDHECVKKVIIYSDGCGYQNRNSVIANALLLFSVKTNIEVEQKYLEKGHTQMECDSIHSVIERKIRKKPVYVPNNYVELIQEARSNLRPYKVEYIDHTFFKKYSDLNYYPSIRPGTGTGSATVTDIRVLQYTAEGIIRYKTNYTDDFEDIPKPRSSRAQKPSQEDTVCCLYSSRLPIKKTKYEHLQQLKSVIPPDYHSFYDCLKHT